MKRAPILEEKSQVEQVNEEPSILESINDYYARN